MAIPLVVERKRSLATRISRRCGQPDDRRDWLDI
jgi:hypothetical protein